MCNRVIQKGRRVKPGGRIVVVIQHRGPSGNFEREENTGETVEVTEGIFSGSARDDNARAWRHGTEVLVPHVSAFGNRDDDTGAEDWENVPKGSAFKAYILPEQQRVDGTGGYRLVKLITHDGGAEIAKRFERGRIPTAVPFPEAPEIPDLPDEPEKPPKKPKPLAQQLDLF